MKITSLNSIFVAHNVENEIKRYEKDLDCRLAHRLSIGPLMLNVMESAGGDRLDLIEVKNVPEGYWGQRVNVDDLELCIAHLASEGYSIENDAFGGALKHNFRVENNIVYLPSCRVAFMKGHGNKRFMLFQHI